MAGAIAEAYYGIPIELEEKALEYLPDDLKGIYHAFRILRKGASTHNAKALSKSEKMS
jgi:ADP-ribosylglycohydrolase